MSCIKNKTGKKLSGNSLAGWWKCSVAAFLVAVVLLFSSAAHAVVIPTYFGWNYVLDAPPLPIVFPNEPAPAVAVLNQITYTGAGGNLVVSMPNFPEVFGMPDAPGFAGPPTFTTGGDGESTRTIGVKILIDWVPAGVAAPYLPAPVAFPTIGISSFAISAGGVGFGLYSGFPFAPNNAGGGTPDYVVGLITAGPDTELVSFLAAPRGDLYPPVNAPGNPSLVAMNTLLGRTDAFTVVFAASVVPEPSSIALATVGFVGLVAWGWRRRRKSLR